MTSRKRTWSRVAVIAGLLGAATVVSQAGPALAACHRFTVEVSPERVNEGSKVTVTITRDASAAPSSIDVETLDDTARAGQDYTKFERTVAFTNETSQKFDIAVINDPTPESDEVFKVHLSNPSGCPPNTNFDIGDDAEVTIAASDTPGNVAPAPTAAPTVPPKAAPSTTARPPVTLAPTTSTTDDALPDIVADDDGGVSNGAIIAAIVVALAVAAAGLIAWRRRQLATDPDGPQRPL